MKPLLVAINGILTFPGSSKNWTGKAVTWAHTHNLDFQGEKIEYFCGPIGRAFGQRGRSYKLFRTLSYYAGRRIVLVGHSNGASVICHMMRDYPNFPHVEHLHLVCGACEADFQKNGLNMLIRERKIDRVTVYVAGNDRALRLAHTWLARFLGYGVLGLHGPLQVAAENEASVTVVKWPVYGHSDCWAENNFDFTMAGFVTAPAAESRNL